MSNNVVLLVYDLSNGMAASLAPVLMPDAPIQGIWHTSVLVYGYEYFYGQGIHRMQPGTTPYGRVVQRHDMGSTDIPRESFEQYLKNLVPFSREGSYHLLSNNCNHFSEEVIRYLTGASIPTYIKSLPETFLNTQLGQTLRPMIEAMFGPSHLAAAGGEIIASEPLPGDIANGIESLKQRLQKIPFVQAKEGGRLDLLFSRLRSSAPQNASSILTDKFSSCLFSGSEFPGWFSEWCSLLLVIPEKDKFVMWDVLRLAALHESLLKDLIETWDKQSYNIIESLSSAFENQSVVLEKHEKAIFVMQLRFLINTTALELGQSWMKPVALTHLSKLIQRRHLESDLSLRPLLATAISHLILLCDTLPEDLTVEWACAVVHFLQEDKSYESSVLRHGASLSKLFIIYPTIKETLLVLEVPSLLRSLPFSSLLIQSLIAVLE